MQPFGKHVVAGMTVAPDLGTGAAPAGPTSTPSPPTATPPQSPFQQQQPQEQQQPPTGGLTNPFTGGPA